MNAHRFPRSAERYANPTHHATQTNVGVMFRVGPWSPRRLAARISASRATEISRAASRTRRLARRRPTGKRRRSSRQYPRAPGLTLTTSPMITNERTTAAAAAAAQSQSGTGRS